MSSHLMSLVLLRFPISGFVDRGGDVSSSSDMAAIPGPAGELEKYIQTHGAGIKAMHGCYGRYGGRAVEPSVRFIEQAVKHMLPETGSNQSDQTEPIASDSS